MRRPCHTTILVIVAGLLTATAAATSPARTASAHTSTGAPPSRPIDWFAPGDSYTSGHGTPGADGDTDCRRSKDSWVYQAAADLAGTVALQDGSPNLVACTGNTTDQFDTQWDRRRHDLITFNFGGDNVHFADVLQSCVVNGLIQAAGSLFDWLHVPTSNCPDDTSIRTMIADFDATYRTFLRHVINDATNSGGNIVVVGYSDLYSNPDLWTSIAGLTGVCDGMLDIDARKLRGWAADLNATIGQAVNDLDHEDVGGRHVHLRFVNVDDQLTNGLANADLVNLFEPPGSSTTHTLCGNAGDWLNGYSLSAGYNRGWHPNIAGHQAEGHLVADTIAGLDWSQLVTPLTVGSTGDTVKQLQTALNAAGYDAGTVDGNYGQQTLAAVAAYRADHGQDANGTSADPDLVAQIAATAARAPNCTTGGVHAAVTLEPNWEWETGVQCAPGWAVVSAFLPDTAAGMHYLVRVRDDHWELAGQSNGRVVTIGLAYQTALSAPSFARLFGAPGWPGRVHNADDVAKFIISGAFDNVGTLPEAWEYVEMWLDQDSFQVWNDWLYNTPGAPQVDGATLQPCQLGADPTGAADPGQVWVCNYVTPVGQWWIVVNQSLTKAWMRVMGG